VLLESARKHQVEILDFKIDSDSMMEIAAEKLTTVKQMIKDVDAKRRTITDPLNQAVNATNDLFRPVTETLTAAEKVLKTAMVNFQEVQAEKARLEREAAERIAAAEREKLALEAAKLQEEADKLAQAADAGEEVDTDKVFEAQAAAAQATAVAEVSNITRTTFAPTKVKGFSTRKRYVVKDVDLLALVKAIAEGKAPIECIEANTAFLRTQAQAFKKVGELFPGVTIAEEISAASR